MYLDLEVLPFNADLIVQISEIRTEFLTDVFQVFSEIGNIEGYLLIIALIYTVFNKRLGIYASIIALSTVILNHLIKISIKNPRPFVVNDQFSQVWDVLPHRMAELATQYSTPSGHAMVSMAFFGLLLLRVKHLGFRIVFLVLLIGIGLARPYLGVHFVEDVLLGWLLGGVIAYLAHMYINNIVEALCKLKLSTLVTLIIVLVCMLLYANYLLENKSSAHYPLAFLSSLGFLSGTLLAISLERKYIALHIAGSTFSQAVARLILMCLVIFSSLTVLKWCFLFVANDASLIGLVLRYIRYFLVSMLGFFCVPWLFTRLNLTKQ